MGVWREGRGWGREEGDGECVEGGMGSVEEGDEECGGRDGECGRRGWGVCGGRDGEYGGRDGKCGKEGMWSVWGEGMGRC